MQEEKELVWSQDAGRRPWGRSPLGLGDDVSRGWL